MMNKLVATLTMAFLVLAASSAFAKGPEPVPVPALIPSGFYVGVQGGANDPVQARGFFQFGWNVGAQVGYRFQNFHLETAFNYLRNKSVFSDGQIGSSAWMFNGYYDFNPFHKVVPFIGVGIGWLHFDFPSWFSTAIPPTIENPNNVNEFAYQVIAGFDYHINSSWSAGFKYHFLKWTNSSDGIYSAVFNILNLNISYSFN